MNDDDLFAALSLALNALANRGYMATGLITGHEGEMIEVTGLAHRPHRPHRGVQGEELSLH